MTSRLSVKGILACAFVALILFAGSCGPPPMGPDAQLPPTVDVAHRVGWDLAASGRAITYVLSRRAEKVLV